MELRGSRTGVFVGCSASETGGALTQDPETVTGYTLTGCVRSMFSNRLSFTFDLRGTLLLLFASGWVLIFVFLYFSKTPITPIICSSVNEATETSYSNPEKAFAQRSNLRFQAHRSRWIRHVLLLYVPCSLQSTRSARSNAMLPLSPAHT